MKDYLKKCHHRLSYWALKTVTFYKIKNPVQIYFELKYNLQKMKRRSSQVVVVAPIKLERRITLLNGITVIVGSIIGSGIFISPKGVLVEIGSVAGSLLIWLACGIFSMIGAYCYTELGTSVTKSGADYVYIYKAFGPLTAFIRLWVDTIIIRPCSAAVVALTFANYVIEAFFPDCQQPTTAVRLLAAFAICK